MTKQRILYALALAGCVLFFLFYEGYLSHLVLTVVLLLPVISLLAALPSCFLVRVRLLDSGRRFAAREETFQATVLIENRSLLPCPEVAMRLTCENLLGKGKEGEIFTSRTEQLCAAVPSRDSVRVSWGITGKWCGKAAVSLSRIRVLDVMGLFRLPVWGQKGELTRQEVCIMPQIREIPLAMEPEEMIPDASDRYSPYKPGNDPSQVFQIREYRPGDDLRRIHWKLSQRLGEKMVREFSLPIDHCLYFLLEAGPDSTASQLDSMMAAFASLSSALAENGYLHWAGWRERGITHWEEIDDLSDVSAVLSRLLGMEWEPQRPALDEAVSAAPFPAGTHLIYCTSGVGGEGFFERLEAVRASEEEAKACYRTNKTVYDSLKPVMEERGKIMAEHKRLDDLYNLLSGNVTGSRMDIETYVQRCYLERILYAANRRFEEMSAGQFELRMFDIDKAGKGKNRGLDLMVYSTVTGKEREVRTLSGGESFMAALCLALGMADQIQESAASVNLDMMFIDEGFGSLDEHSRDKAVRVLQDMAGGSRLIGIISHVTELKQEIEDQLIVRKDEEGSHVRWQIS